MRKGAGLAADAALPENAEAEAERRRMSFFDLFFLAAGGVIGSGWLFSPVQQGVRLSAVFPWLVGGALMLAITAVMVELSTVVPKTGGLVFLPLQSSGPLLATVVAAGVWVFYAVDPATEAVAVVRGLAIHGMVNSSQNGLTWPGIGWAMLIMVPMAAINLLGPRLFLMVNNVLTAFKIMVPLLIIALLPYAQAYAQVGPHAFPPLCRTNPDSGSAVFAVVSAVASGGVMYAYLGFQGPLDFAGNVKRRGIGEAARLRRAVYGTVCGSIFLYVALQLVLIYIAHHSGGSTQCRHVSPYIGFVRAVAPGWAVAPVAWLVKLDTVLSPVGTGMIFTYVLTREVAALSRAHLTHRGLQKKKYSVIPLSSRWLGKLFGDDWLDVFWLILIVDFVVSGISLLCCVGEWSVINTITSIMALVVYATPSVVLASLRKRDPELFPRKRYSILAEFSFVSITVVFFLTGWDQLWAGMAALAVGCLLLFCLPLVVPASRWYDAKAHAVKFRKLRTNPAALSAAVLFGHFTVLLLAALVVKYALPAHPAVKLGIAVLLAVLAVIVFRWLVTLSVRYMAEHAPTLPTRSASRATELPP